MCTMKINEHSFVGNDQSLDLQLLIDSVPALIHTARPDGFIDFFNQTWLDFVGQPLDKLLGWGWTSRIHPDDVEEFVKKRRESIADGSRFEEIARVRRADGEYRWMVHSAVPRRDAGGNVVKWFGSSVDIEDRKRTEEALRQSEAYLAEGQRLVHAGSWALDLATGQYVYVSEEDFRIWGLDPRDGSPSRETVLGLIHPGDRDRWKRKFESGLNTKEDSSDEYRIVLPDGTVKHIHTIRHPVLNDAGDVVRLVGTSIDITERKRAEEALRRSEAYLAAAQTLTHTGTFASDGTTKPLYWSEEMFRIFGFDPYDGIPARETATQRIHPDDRSRWKLNLEKTLREKVDTSDELRIVLPDGTIKYVSLVRHPVLDEAGELVEVVGTIVDISDRKLAEESLRRSEAYLAEAQRLSHTGSWALDVDSWSYVYWSQEMFRIYGFDPERGLPTREAAFRRLVPEDWSKVEANSQRSLREKIDTVDEYRIVLPDGTVKDLWMTRHPVLNDAGNLVQLIGTTVDITERKRAEEAIRQSEKQLRDVFEGIPAMASAIRVDGSVEFINQRWREYTGMSVEEATGSGWQSAINPQDIGHYLEKRRAALASGKPYEGEFRLRGANGEYRWFLARVVPLRNEQRNILRWYAILTDIDYRKQAEERLQHENVALREEIDKSSMFEEIVGSSAALRAVLSRVAKVAPSESTVLITGETGTGKELIARAIHKRSPRSSKAFVSVNCASIPRDLIASELFGHEKGAFTGATQRHLGRFELADGGTIFLDEVGDLPAETQIALLRVLQEREFQRVGGDRSIPSNVRVIAATNRNLQAAIDSGAFRNDLFYRLNVFPIETPPLRKRKEDIPLLVAYFIDRYTRKSGKKIRQISKKSLELLQSYPWPGNIRELQNVIERSVIVCETDTFSVDESWLSSQPSAAASMAGVGLSQMLASEEREAIEAALRECRGRVSGHTGAAARLGVPRSTLESRIRALRIDKNRFKAI